MIIAGIAVASAIYAIDKPYDYLVPAPLEAEAQVGTRVVVPFGRGNRRSEGVILSLREGTANKLKALESVLDPAPVLDERMLRLAAFMRERYFCTFFEAIHAMLPAGLWYQAKDQIVLTALGEAADPETACARIPEGRRLLAALLDFGGQAPAGQLRTLLGQELLEKGLAQLQRKKLALSEASLIRKVSDKTEKLAALAVSPEEARDCALRRRKRAPLQSAILDILAVVGSCAVKELFYFTGASHTSLKPLVKAGYVELSAREVFRRPVVAAGEKQTFSLSDEQAAAYAALRRDMEAQEKPVSLLHGVTGSGKTAIYLRLIEDCLNAGRAAVVLVPEISLTPQLLRLFVAQFGDLVAVLHSSLQMSQRYDEWKRIRAGEARVVVGTRSAVFAPTADLGLLIVDEEHEHTYKSEMAPRYHAREIAIYRGRREQALVLLGSATPAVETMYLARQGVFHLNVLRDRYNGKALPQVLFADMKEELRQGNDTSISALLQAELDQNIRDGRQSILYINRRGTSRLVVCPQCGTVPGCPRCSVSLTYHAANNRLMCHYCGYSQPAETTCAVCGAPLRQVGTGTQRVEAELKALFPWAETLRMDADTVSAANPHEKLLDRFQREQIPILIGTQMVTKGLNFENVTLVGVLDGDGSLYTDDYRAAENTFDKITQVIGRAGRGSAAGRAVIQTMTPDNQVLRQAAAQDYDAFYETELPLREMRHCPPFADVLCIHFFGIFEGEVTQGALEFRERLRAALGRCRVPDSVSILGPAPDTVVRVMNRYHYRLTLLGKNTKQLRAVLAAMLKWFSKEKKYRKVTASADVNPYD